MSDFGGFYAGDISSLGPDDRLDAPPFHRNHGAILEVVRRYLPAVSGHALEIGSGTGQHVIAFARAFSHVHWWPTDVDRSRCRSVEAWRRHSALPNVAAPVVLDASSDDWSPQTVGVPEGEALAAFVCINVLHIAPWAVAEGLIRGAGRYLDVRGRLFIYGPFMRDGAHTALSNAAFDQSLRARDASWGVRDLAEVEALAHRHGLVCQEVAAMPANNLTLVFGR